MGREGAWERKKDITNNNVKQVCMCECSYESSQKLLFLIGA